MIRPADGRPPYRQIADDLRRRIDAGAYAPSGKLQSEAYLAHQYGTGRGAVRHALAHLEALGVIVRTPGAVAQVRQPGMMSTVEVGPGHLIRARLATAEERAEWGVPVGAIALVAVDEATGVEWDSWPADRVEIRPVPPSSD